MAKRTFLTDADKAELESKIESSKGVARTVTLRADSWEDLGEEGIVNIITFTDNPAFVKADSIVICSVSPNKAMEEEVARCMVRLVEQGNNWLDFYALNGTAPTIDIDMNILVVGV